MPSIPIGPARASVVEAAAEVISQQEREENDERLRKMQAVDITRKRDFVPDDVPVLPGLPKKDGSVARTLPAEDIPDDPDANARPLGRPPVELSPEEIAGDVPDPSWVTGVGGTGGPEDEVSSLSAKFKARREAQLQSETRSRLLDPASTPDQAAADLDLATKSGVNRIEVEQDRETYKAVNQAKEIDQVYRKAPLLRDWLADRANFDIAHDDLENLSWWETIGSAFNPGSMSSDEAKRALQSGTDQAAGGLLGLEELGIKIADFTTGWMPGVKEGVDYKGALATVKDKRQELSRNAAANAPQGDTLLEKGVYDALQSAPQTVGALVATLVTRSPTMGALSAGAVTGGSAFGEAEDKGKDFGTSLRYAFEQGGIEAATELLPLKFLIGDLAKDTPFFKTFLKQATAEGIGEQAATFLQDASSWLELNPEKTVGEFLAERPEAAIRTLIASTIMSGVQTTIAKGADSAGTAIAQAAQQNRADELSKTFDAMAKGAKDSKLLKRIPDKYREAVAQVTKDGPLEEVRVTPDALTELAQANNLTTDQLAQAFRIDPADMVSAIASGNDVVIPAGNYAAALGTAQKEIGISGEAIHTALAPNMRLRASDFTAKEHEAMQKVFEEEQKAREDQTGKTQEFADSADRVRETIREAVAATKLFNTETANTQAAIAGEMVVTLAERTGQDPEKLWNELGFDVVAALSGEEDQASLPQQKGRTPAPIDDETLTRAASELSEKEFEAWKGAREGLTNEDIAVRMGGEDGTVTLTAVSVYLGRAREKGFDSAKQAGGRPQAPETEAVLRMLARDVRPVDIVRAIFPDRDPKKAQSQVSGMKIKYADRIEAIRQKQLVQSGALAQDNMRGSYTPRADRSVIKLFESTNLSTFVHEASHWYLDTLWRMSQTENPHPFVLEQLAAIKEWKGKSPEWSVMFDAQGVVTPEGRDLHEAFAESFEAYLREGKAPSTSLRSVFASLKQWLMRIYKSISQIGSRVNLNDEIRAVFDRALASEEAIKAASASMSRDSEAMAKALLDKGVITEKAFERTKERLAAAREKAEAELTARLMEDYERNQKAWWRDQERQVRREVQSEVDERPEQRAYAWLSGKGWRDTRADHVEEAAAEAEVMAALAQTAYDLNTPAARAEWVRTQTAQSNIPGETLDAKQWGFKLDDGTGIVVSIAPDPNGESVIEWTFLDRLRTFTQEMNEEGQSSISDLYKQGGPDLTVSQLKQLLARVAAIVETDMRETERDAYTFTPATKAIGRINARLLKMIDRGPYEIIDFPGSDANSDVLVLHTDARLANNGKITPRPENAGRKLQWDDGERAEERQNDFYAAVEALSEPVGSSARGPAGTSDDRTGTRTPELAYVEQNATDDSIKALRDRMLADGIVPVILLFRTTSGRVIAFPGDNGTSGFHHDLARQMLELGNLKLDHGVYNPRKWPTLAAMDAAGEHAWYATTGTADDGEARRPARLGEEGAALGQSIKPSVYYGEPLVLDVTNRVFRPGQPDDLGFITSAERALANPPKRFKDAKALTAEQWRKWMREAGATKEAFTYQIEPALAEISAKKNGGALDVGQKARPAYTGDITRAEFEEGLARHRLTLRNIQEGAGPKGAPPDELDDPADIVARTRGRTEVDYSAYVAPGKFSNYRQELLIAPGIDYKSHNWVTEGVLGHIRTTERVSAKGEKVLHVEELQSDLHQEGAKYGYRGGPESAAHEAALADFDRAGEKWRAWMAKNPDAIAASGRVYADGSGQKMAGQLYGDATGDELYREYQAAQSRAMRDDGLARMPPRAPMESWEEPFIKRVLFRAAQEGYDTVTFPSWGTLHSALKNDGTKAFYDERLPATIKRVAKSLGVPPEEVKIEFGRRDSSRTRVKMADGGFRGQFKDDDGVWRDIEDADVLYSSRAEGEAAVRNFLDENEPPGSRSVLAIRLTPAAKETILQGSPLYQGGDGAGRTSPPPSLSPMRLNLEAVRETYGEEALAALPPEVRAYAASATDADQFVEIARDVRKTLNQKKPKTLTKFLSTRRVIGHGNDTIAYKGIRDEELAAAFIGEEAPKDLFAGPPSKNSKTRVYTMSDAVMAAWAEGYFNGPVPSPEAFIEALRRDADETAPLYRKEDLPTVQQIRDAERWEQWFEDSDVDISLPPAELKARLEEVLTGEAENAIGPDEAAPYFGMPDGNALLQGLKEGPKRNAIIRQMTEQRMTEMHGDPFKDGTIMQEAEQYARNEVQTRQDEIELEALARAAGQQFAGNLAKQQAQEALKTKQVREVLNYNQWLILEQRWMKKAVEAAEKGKFDEALDFKRYGLINRHMFREGRKLAEQIEKNRKHLLSYGDKTKQARLFAAGAEYQQQMNGLLADYQLRPESKRAEDNRANRSAWIRAQMAAIDPYAAYQDNTKSPAEQIAEAQEALERSEVLARLAEGVDARNYKSLPTGEFLAVRDEADLIWRLATTKDRLIREGERRRLTLAAEDIAAEIYTNQPNDKPPEPRESDAPGEALKRGGLKYFAMHRTLQSLAQQFAGGKDGGVFWRYIVKPMNESFARLSTLRKKMGTDMEELFGLYTKAERNRFFNDRKHFASIGESLTKQGRLAVALNWGNEKNRQRLMDSTGWSEAGVREILDTLDKRDWDFIQKTWDYLDTWFPEANRVHEAVHNAPMDKVAPLQVATKYGIYAGGYFPIAFDPNLSTKSGQRQLEAEAKAVTGRVGVRNKPGFGQRRVEGRVTLPLRLSVFDVVARHLDQVATSIATEEALYDAGRLIMRPEVQTAIIERHGRQIYNTIVNTLVTTKFGLEGASGVLAHLRNGATVVGLGWKVATALLQPLGVTNSIVRVGGYWIAKGYARMGTDALTIKSSADWIMERSEFMQHRRQSQSPELAALKESMGKKGLTPRWVTGSMFALMSNVQFYSVDMPTWYGAYYKAQAAGLDEGDSVAQADQAVIDAQGGGELHQTAAIQTGAGTKYAAALRLLTNFMSYMVTTYNLATQRARNANTPAKAAALGLDMILLLAVPVAGKLALDAWTKGGGDDDDDPLWEKYGREQIAFLLSPFVGVSQVAGAVRGDDAFGYRGPAGLGIFAEATNAGKAAAELDFDESFWRPANKTAGMIFHYPASQLDATVRGGMAMWKGETSDPKVLLFGPPSN